MEIHTNRRMFSLQSQAANIENQKFTIICITLFPFHVGICFALFQTRILCQRTIVSIAPTKTTIVYTYYECLARDNIETDSSLELAYSKVQLVHIVLSCCLQSRFSCTIHCYLYSSPF